MARTKTQPAAIAALLIVLTAVAAVAAPPKTPPAQDLTPAFREAGVTLANLQVFEVGGIVLLRGRASDKAQAEQVGVVARSLGYERVANLIQVIEAPDDAAIQRRAEVELAIHRSLDGCRFTVESKQGVLRIGGSVRHELQKDVAIQLLRNIDGVREVRLDLVRF